MPSISRTSKRVQIIPPSGIRKFFDIAATMADVISLGIGDPDFVTPDVLRQAGMASLTRGETHYISTRPDRACREALASHLSTRYSVDYDPVSEILVSVGVSEALYLGDGCHPGSGRRDPHRGPGLRRLRTHGTHGRRGAGDDRHIP